MRLTKEHIGQKFRAKEWDKGNFFLPLVVGSKGNLIGEYYSQDFEGTPFCDERGIDWLPYEEPKKNKLLLAPAIEVEMYNYPRLNNNLFQNKEQADQKLKIPLNWPARIVIKNAKFNVGDSHDLGDITGDLFFEVEK